MLVSMLQEMQFFIFLTIQNTSGSPAHHNTTIVYISTLTYEKDSCDLKAIPSQTDITEQQISEDMTVIMLTNCIILCQILI